MKTISKKQFRILLTLSIVTSVASAVAGVLDSRLLPQPLLDYRELRHGEPSVQELVAGVLGIPGLIAALIAVIGLYKFWHHARWLGVAAWADLLVCMAISPGPVLTNAVASALSNCSTLLAGAILAIIYFSPAAEWFDRKEVNART